jgi:hypothetical protein
MKNIILLLIFSIISTNVFSRDALVLKLKGCRYLKGFILAVDEKISFLDMSGKIQLISEEEISLILTYGISESPFKKSIQFAPDFSSKLKNIYLRSEDKVITGFPFQYIEDLSFIMGIDGKMYVLALSEIVSIKDYTGELKSSFGNNKQYFFDYSDYQSGCKAKKEKGKIALRPVRVLGDRIKVSEFIENYKKGYRTFVDLQERTHFYAKPFLYPKRNRLGILSLKSKKTALPFYFQWTTGEDFHFQSVNRFGGMISPYLPTFEAGSVLSTEFKSHFFHGYFEGNILGLSSGKVPTDFKTDAPKVTSVVANYNYMAFMGADWKKYSFSYGGGYLTPYFQYKKSEIRELTANKLATAVMVRFTGDWLKLKGVTYLIDDASSSNFEIGDQINITSDTVTSIDTFKVKGNFHRFGIEFDLPDNASLGADYLIGSGEYEELAGVSKNTIKFTTNEYMIYLKKSFGHYITLKAIMKSNTTEIDQTISAINGVDEDNDTYYGGVFELLF